MLRLVRTERRWVWILAAIVAIMAGLWWFYASRMGGESAQLRREVTAARERTAAAEARAEQAAAEVRTVTAAYESLVVKNTRKTKEAVKYATDKALNLSDADVVGAFNALAERARRRNAERRSNGGD